MSNLDNIPAPLLYDRHIFIQHIPEEVRANRIQLRNCSDIFNLRHILRQQSNGCFDIAIYALDTCAQLTQEFDHRATPEALDIGHIRTERPANRAKAGHFEATRLINQNTINGIRGEIMLNLLEEPGTKRLLIETRDLVITPMAIHYTRLRMTKCIQLGTNNGPAKRFPW